MPKPSIAFARSADKISIMKKHFIETKEACGLRLTVEGLEETHVVDGVPRREPIGDCCTFSVNGFAIDHATFMAIRKLWGLMTGIDFTFDGNLIARGYREALEQIAHLGVSAKLMGDHRPSPGGPELQCILAQLGAMNRSDLTFEWIEIYEEGQFVRGGKSSRELGRASSSNGEASVDLEGTFKIIKLEPGRCPCFEPWPVVPAMFEPPVEKI